MMKSGRKLCMKLCTGLMSILLMTSIVSAQVRQVYTSQSTTASPFAAEPDWLIVSHDARSDTGRTDPLSPSALDGLPDAIEMSVEPPLGVMANPYEADLDALQKRIDQLEATEKKRSE